MSQGNPQKIIDQFFDLYRENINEAIDYIFDTNPWIKGDGGQVANVKLQLERTVSVVGNYEGYTFIDKKTAGEHLVQYVFMVRYDRQPLRFIMLFYKPASTWRLHHFAFDDNMEDELRTSAPFLIKN